ncbi:CRISPR-associated endonuclease Cas2 [Thermobrachium celere]|uniref:CRISPR-associated endoribonuclease Cas2 n=1 Tax=Thermobrachium celere DSM 8682 TaxID=941824 RepID=R7RUS3_9CLOT|nr:CRISPR-associated endonuclease Cas2 [Thermobrachium celere]CDF59223.1 CRISPR-associated protein Cas2 [Thermobrachium celere DSM 8682]
MNEYKNLYVISYDIPKDRTRNRVSKVLEGFGQRVQYSLFECRLNNTQLQMLKVKLMKLINNNEDSIIIYRLTPEAQRFVEYIGLKKHFDEDIFYV